MNASAPSLSLSALPLSFRLTLTAFFAMIGFGYLAAVGNLYHQHQLADGEEGLTINDLRVTFHGIEVEPGEKPAVLRSRMTEMIEPGGDMRADLVEGGPEAVRALETWLSRGALEAEFSRKGLSQDGDPSAKSVIENQCLLCHNADDGEKSDEPFGPDIFEARYDMVYSYAEPGTAETKLPASGPTRRGPQSPSHLFLVTHIHMLSIPVFTLIVGGAFLLTPLPRGLRGWLAPLPMVTLAFDFGSWWLARSMEPLIYVIAAAGAVFGVTFGFQIVAVAVSLWWRPAK